MCSGVKDIFLKLLRPGLNYRRAFSDHVDKVNPSFSSVVGAKHIYQQLDGVFSLQSWYTVMSGAVY